MSRARARWAKGRWRTLALAGALAGASAEAIVTRHLSPQVIVGEASAPHFVERFDAAEFARGNLHAHSSLSDGDAPPEALYAWYRAHGYRFVAVTDHNALTALSAVGVESRRDFVVLRGEEISMWAGGHPVHVNAICAHEAVDGGTFASASEAIAYAVGHVRDGGGIALLNHPNFDWALTADDVRGARGEQLLEIASGHPYVYERGGPGHPGHERLWDEALTAGVDVMGVAVDDVHHLLPEAPEPAARPGRAWVEVFTGEASEAAICDALGRGRLYASTGVGLLRVAVDERSYAVWPEAEGDDVTFVGAGGRELERCRAAVGRPCRYEPRGGEGYVRVRVGRVDCAAAWTPAVRVAEGG